MYFKFVVAALVFVSLTLADDVGEPDDQPPCVTPTCYFGEEYQTCVGPEPTCEEPNPPCDNHCHTGCFCVSGFVREPSGNCVPPFICALLFTTTTPETPTEITTYAP